MTFNPKPICSLLMSTVVVSLLRVPMKKNEITIQKASTRQNMVWSMSNAKDIVPMLWSLQTKWKWLKSFIISASTQQNNHICISHVFFVKRFKKFKVHVLSFAHPDPNVCFVQILIPALTPYIDLLLPRFPYSWQMIPHEIYPR